MNMPEIVIKDHCVDNWEEIFEWAVCNVPLANRSVRMARDDGFSYLEELKLLCAHLLRANEGLKELMIEGAKQSTPAYIFIEKAKQ